jgi:enoyl-CoA hydratase/carnithine racemase
MEAVATESFVVTEQTGQVALIRLNRPDKRNAMNREARRQLMAALDSIRLQCKVVVVTGTDSYFCSGIDLNEAREDAEQQRPADLKSDWIEVLLAIREHPAIFIAAANGIALGGGSTLISVCDLAVAAEEAEIGMPEVGFGAYPQFSGPGAQLQLTSKRAAWLVLTGERINGITAASWGAVNFAVPRANLVKEALSLANKISQFNGTTLAQAKRALDTIPAKITDWRSAFEYGLDTNLRIRHGRKS